MRYEYEDKSISYFNTHICFPNIPFYLLFHDKTSVADNFFQPLFKREEGV